MAKFTWEELEEEKIALYWDEDCFLEVSRFTFFKWKKEMPKFSSLPLLFEWILEKEKKMIKNYILYLLGRQRYLHVQIESRLKRKGISPSSFQPILEELAPYFQDEEYIEELIYKRLDKGYGPLAITAYLQGKGVSYHSAKSFIHKICTEQVVKEALKKVIDKHTIHSKREIAKLQRKGFALAVIYDLSKELFS